MDTNGHESLLRDVSLPHAALVYSIVGAAFEVLKEIGHGLHEKPYENALVVEFGLRNLALEQQRSLEIFYKGKPVGLFVPDLLVANAVVVDTKVIERITNAERGQMMNYLRMTKLKVGVMLNFHRPKVEWERIVL